MFQAYIVYLGSLPEGEYSPSAQHLSLLQAVVDARDGGGVVSVFPSRTFRVRTTRSWNFMGFQENITQNHTVESDTIVGVIDTGLWPESASFSDEGFGPAPKKWKGKCEGGKNFTCNNKIIGARFYSSLAPADSARDDTGHRSHTASTAAGNKVKDVNFYGLAEGIARGGSDGSCQGVDILAAFDDAIVDGVDIITVSLGPDFAVDIPADEISVGSFHAIEKGILTVNSAGNSGPTAGTVATVALWMLAVAASSIDCGFIDKVVLGNGKTLIGSSVNSFTLNGAKFPLVYGTNASSLYSVVGARLCFVINLVDIQRSSALGSIEQTSQPDNVPFVVPFPASALTSDDSSLIKSYMSSAKSPQAAVLKSEVIKDSTAPIVASFSSRGPNIIAQDIMKRRVEYNVLSGTSMSCPHAAGVAAYVKTFYPDWSPSAIKSTIMTTAWCVNPAENSDAEFAYGSGHLNPLEAINPGLVDEALKDDCISGDNSSCPRGGNKASPKNFNYPSMTAQVFPSKSFRVRFERTVTNVGLAKSTYKAIVFPSSKLNITVILFVWVTGGGLPIRTIVSSSLVWSDGTHRVRSPIIMHTK
ncbi:hypothetical protein P3X46_015657 [Hevea brasiliensis]|uniref:Peptidase S8/S53 domain-containing protein n=1 Tax=Hevea brasiliensis TaxID=3981 RepID=A0ABQ9M0M6_HEVBR|nr:hypothetical protein P3X46_015657 [Hevea brasiliensis]